MPTLWPRGMRYLGLIYTNHYSAPRMYTWPLSQNLQSVSMGETGNGHWVNNLDFWHTHSSNGSVLGVSCAPKGTVGCWGVEMNWTDRVPLPWQFTVYRATSVCIMHFVIPNIWIIFNVPERQKEWRDLNRIKFRNSAYTPSWSWGTEPLMQVSGVNGGMRQKYSALVVDRKLWQKFLATVKLRKYIRDGQLGEKRNGRVREVTSSVFLCSFLLF